MSTETSDIDPTSRNCLTISPSTSLPEVQADAIGLETPITYYTDEGAMSKEEEEQRRVISPSCEGRTTNECQPVTSSEASGDLVKSFLAAARTAAVDRSNATRRKLYLMSVALLQNEQAVTDRSTSSQDIVNDVSALRDALNAMTVNKPPTASAHGVVKGYRMLGEAAFALASSIDPNFTSDLKDQ